MWNDISSLDVHDKCKSVSVLDHLPKSSASTIVKSVLTSINDISRSNKKIRDEQDVMSCQSKFSYLNGESNY